MPRFGWIAALALLAGCDPAPQTTAADASPPVEAAAAAPASQDEVTLQILDYEGIQKLIAGHRGKFVVMDAWSTYCPPCVKEFPNLVQLSKKYPDELACISLSFDYEGLDPPEVVQGPVLAFLQQQGATFDNVLSSEEADALYRKLDLAAVPAVFVYDQQGSLLKRFDNSTGEEVSYAEVEAYLAEQME